MMAGQPFASSSFKPLSETLICRDALMDLLGVGRKWWLTVLNHCNNYDTLPNQHKLKGQPPNNKRKWNEMYTENLIQHFEDLPRKEAGPLARLRARSVYALWGYPSGNLTSS